MNHSGSQLCQHISDINVDIHKLIVICLIYKGSQLNLYHFIVYLHLLWTNFLHSLNIGLRKEMIDIFSTDSF